MKSSFFRFRIFFLFVLAFSFVLFSAWNVKAQYTIFSSQVPASSGTDDNYELGTKFNSSHLAEITAIRFYKMPGETGAHTGKIWSAGGGRLAEVTFSSESSSGWQTAVLSSPLKIDPGLTYVVSVNANTEYPITQNAFSSTISNGFLTGEMGVFNTERELFPTDTYNSSSYFVDIVASPLDQVFTDQVPEESFTGEGPIELGLKFTTSSAAKVRFIRFYKAAGETDGHTGNLWDMAGNKLASVTFSGETATGWQYAALNTDVYLAAGTAYVVSVNSNTVYGATKNALASSITNGILTTTAGSNGVFNSSAGSFPTEFFGSPNYFRDIVVIPLYTPPAPVNPSPLNEMTGVSIEPVLSWGAIAGVTSYTLEIAEDASFTAGLKTFTNLTSNSFAITGLSNSKSYYWHVKGVNDIVQGDWSSTFKFTTIAHTDVVLSYPKGGARLYSDKPSFTWYVPAGGTGWKYDLIYSADENFLSFVTVTNLTQSQYTLEGLQGGRTYYWKVRLKTSTGAVVGYSGKESFISFGEALKPVASWPLGDATVYSLSQDLYWYLNGSSLGLTYDLEIREGDPTALTNTATNTGINEMHFKATGLSAGKQYSWHVKSKSASGEYSSWSDAVSFKTAAAKGAIVPVASWPVGYPVVYTLTPSLNWYLGAASDGLTFDVEIVEGLETSFTDTPTFEGLTSLFVVTGPLTPGKDYKWQVRSYDGVNHSDWSEPATFNIAGTIGNAPVVPYPSWPVGGALVYSAKATLSWYTGTFSTGLKYDVEYGQGALTGTPTVSNISDLFVEVSGLEAGKTYNWSVRSTSPLGESDWSKTETFKTVSNTPVAETPILSWPADGVTVYTNSPLLSWFLNSSSAGLTYELSYSTSSSMTGAVTFSGITETQYELKNLTPGATYYWQVRSFDGTVYSNPSETGSFAVYAGSAAVVPLAGSPVEGVQTGSTSPVLSWFIPSIGDVQSYIVEYSKKPDMSAPVSLEVKGNSVTLDKLQAESSYYWHVRSLNSKGEKSAFSETESFSTSSTTGAEEKGPVPSEFALRQNFPNPFNPATMIEFSLARDGFYSLEVYNVLGQKVRSLMQGNMKAGSYKVNFNAKDLVSGIYFYRLSGNGVMMVKKMMLVK